MPQMVVHRLGSGNVHSKTKRAAIKTARNLLIPMVHPARLERATP